MAFCSGLREGCSVWPRPHTPEKAAGKAAITFRKQRKGLWPWSSCWSSSKTWLIPYPEGEQCAQGGEMLLKAGSPPSSAPREDHLLDVHVLQERAVGLQNRQGCLVIVFIVAARALPALCLLDSDDLKCRRQVS